LQGWEEIRSNTLASYYYHPVYKKDIIFKLMGRAGHITGYGGKKVKLNDRFYLGPDFIRGFDIGGFGPRDIKTLDSLGGNMYYVGNMEISFPLGLPSEVGLRGIIFNDFGSVFGLDKEDRKKVFDKKSLRASAGAGVIWKSPLGTIGLYYGVPYKKEKFDDIRHFYFNIGTKF
jgi:outer membrane protein insertion porin family